MAYKDKDAQREYQRQWVARRRAKYIAIHGGKCEKCGNESALEFDHIDPGTKISHKIWSWREARIENELAKCQLICNPCHQTKTVAEMEYPERKHGTNLMYLKAKCKCEACKAAHAAVNAEYR